MKWLQDRDTGKMYPADEAAFKRDNKQGQGFFFVRGNIDAFKSPIDGTEIKNNRQYQDHCRKHNVVPSAEFSPEFFERKKRERESFFGGEHTKAQKLRRKQEIHEHWTRLERQ